jgi:hypothetical protein
VSCCTTRPLNCTSGALLVHGLAQQQHRVDPDQHAALVGVAVAGAGAALGDLAQDGACVALDLGGRHALVARAGALQHLRLGGFGQAIGSCVFGHLAVLWNGCIRPGGHANLMEQTPNQHGVNPESNPEFFV